MGGDDLGEDNDYEQLSVGSLAEQHDESEESGDETEVSKKRKPPIDDSLVPKKKRELTCERQLLEAGRNLDRKSAEQQSSFLQSALQQYLLLESNEKITDCLIRAEHIQSSSKDNLEERLRECISAKKLKNWNHRHSPRVIIICGAARRAVAVLKELSSLKIRMAKLFPKNGSVDEQLTILGQNPFGIAVGTPHRLCVLAAGIGGKALSLEHTELVVFDSHVSNKMYSVCTLPDTSPHCMSFLKEFLLPQLQKRKSIKIAFF